MDFDNIFNKLIEVCGEKYVFKNIASSTLCTFKVGGNAKIVVYVHSVEQFVIVLQLCKDIKHIVIGNASNVVFSDLGYDGVIIVTSALNEIEVINGNQIQAQSGAQLTRVAIIAQENELEGLEFSYGIPGTVGGAVFMNAGAYGSEMKNVIKSVTVLDKNLEIKVISLEQCNFSYRHSLFMEDEFYIISAVFKLNKGNADLIKEKMNQNMSSRRTKQPLEYPSAGSVFKRPEGYFAGKLIQDSGLKGYKIGGAQVSEKHSGFIINAGNATADDIKNLVKHIQQKVKQDSDVELKCEIRFID